MTYSAKLAALLSLGATLSMAQILPPPVPEALTVTPASVDVTSADQHVQATLRVKYLSTDDVQVGATSLAFINPIAPALIGTPLSSTPVPCGTPTAGLVCANLQYDVAVPQANPVVGLYSPYVNLSFNRSPFFVFYDPTALLGLGINATITVTAGPGPSPACTLPPPGPGIPSGGISDTTPPTLVALCLSSYSIDVRTAAQRINLFLNISDDLSGFQYAYVNFSSPSGVQFQQSYVPDAVRIQGNSLSGIYQATATLPLHAEPGIWTMTAFLVDRVGNSNSVFPAGMPPSFTVISSPDITPPVIKSVLATPSSVNVSAASQTVTFTVNAADDVSGVDFTSGRSYFALSSPSGGQVILLSPGPLVSGTVNDGSWQTQLTIPRYSEPGAWKIQNFSLYDFAGNTLFGAQGFGGVPPINLTVSSSPFDVSPPVVNTYNLTPAFINTSTGDQNVTITLALTDNLAGLFDPNFLFPFVNCSATYVSPSGQQSHFSNGGTIVDSGTPTSAVVKITIPMPQFSEIGTWSLGGLTCYDLANNQLILTKADAQSKHFDINLIVIQPSQTPDGAIGPAGGTVQDQGSVTKLTVPPGAFTTPTTVAIDVLAQPPFVPIPQGFSVGSAFINIDLNPKPATPLPPPGLSLVIPLQFSHPPGSSLILFRIDPVSGKLNPAPSVGGGMVIGTVDPSGLTATFTGIASFSTVVALDPPTSPGDLNGDNVVNCADIAIIRNSWGKRFPQDFDQRADYNRDGAVNIFDLAAVSKFLPRGMKCN